MDRWEILILNLISHVNPGNEYSSTWIQCCIRIHLQQPLSRLYWIKLQHHLLKATHHIKTKEPHNGILSLKSPDMFQTSRFHRMLINTICPSPLQFKVSTAHRWYSDKTDFISFILKKTEVSPHKRKQTINKYKKTKKQQTKIHLF